MGDVRIAYATTWVPGVELRDRVVARQRALLPQVEVIRDPEREGVWPTTLRAYERLDVFAPPGTTHVLVLQDDMLPCDDFDEHLTAALTAVPEAPVALFTMRKVIDEALAEGKHWAVTGDGTWGGSTALPHPWVRPFIDWAIECVEPGYKHDDRRLAAWLHWTGRTPVWHTAPPLLQHVGAGESLLGQSNATRVSRAFLLHPPEPFDWTRGIDAPAKGAGMSSQLLAQVRENLTPAGRAWYASEVGK